MGHGSPCGCAPARVTCAVPVGPGSELARAVAESGRRDGTRFRGFADHAWDHAARARAETREWFQFLESALRVRRPCWADGDSVTRRGIAAERQQIAHEIAQTLTSLISRDVWSALRSARSVTHSHRHRHSRQRQRHPRPMLRPPPPAAQNARQGCTALARPLGSRARPRGVVTVLMTVYIQYVSSAGARRASPHAQKMGSLQPRLSHAVVMASTVVQASAFQ